MVQRSGFLYTAARRMQRSAMLLVGTLCLAACGGGDVTDSAVPDGTAGSASTASAASASTPVTAAGAVPLVQLPARRTAQVTSNALDLSIDGDGWFLTFDTRNQQRVATRYGRFYLAPHGLIVDAEGRVLLGRAAQAPYGTSPGITEPVPLLMPPQATRHVRLNSNLRASAWQLSANGVPDMADASTFNNATSQTIYDPAGRALVLTTYFRKVGDGAWQVWPAVNGQWLTASQPASTLLFDPSGVLRSGGRFVLTVPAVLMPGVDGGLSAPMPALEVDLGSATQFDMAFQVSEQTQDGYPAGRLLALEVLPRGEVRASFSNGQWLDVFRLLLARFSPTDRFMPVGTQGYACTTACSEPFIEEPGTFLLGQIVSRSLEQ